VSAYSPNLAAKAELGRWSFMIDFIGHAIKYWLRICKHDRNSLVYKRYLDNYQTHRDSLKTITWCNSIKNILKQFNLLTVWENQGTKNENKIRHLLKRNMTTKYETEWKKYISEESKKTKNLQYF
jgi:hypothetical protein